MSTPKVAQIRASEISTRRKDIVSTHAIIRWLERVEGVDMEKIRSEAEIVVGYRPENDTGLLLYMKRYHRLDENAVRRKVATEYVMASIKAGLREIRIMNRRFRLVITNGTIATVK